MNSSNQTTPVSSNYRWVICALLFWVTTANYIDRGVFGNLAPEMPKYLRLADKVQPAEVEQYWSEHAKEIGEAHAKHQHRERRQNLRGMPGIRQSPNRQDILG